MKQEAVKDKTAKKRENKQKSDKRKSIGRTPKQRLEKLAERWEENRFRAYFIRLFEKYDIRNEEKFIRFGKWLIFIILVCLEGLIFLQYFGDFLEDVSRWKTLVLLLSVEAVLTVTEWFTLFVKKDEVSKRFLYAIDSLAASALMFFSDGTYPIVVYMLVLTEFYIDSKHKNASIVVFCVFLPVYIMSNAVKFFLLTNGEIGILQILTRSFGGVFALFIHFIIVNVALAFYRQFLRLDRTTKELDESNRKLEKAYAMVAEVTALEERQRIAKEIHDTAGHSITTVIMQTEAAKLIIDQDAEEAKNKIVAANLQARHALEELRDSVHLLSGMTGNMTLKMLLEHIIQESMDGTGVKIRSQIEDLMVSDEKYRFLSNALKEGISNGLRHGKATAFWFELKEEDGEIFFLLSDNGAGFNGEALHLGFGLSAMRERARALGGDATFESEIEEGFEICITLPLEG